MKEMNETNEIYHYTECGLDNVYLVSGYDIVESPTGRHQVTIKDIDGLHEAVGRHLIKSKKDLNGDEIRFLRHEMLMSQSVLARLLDVSDQTINRWERDKSNVPKPAEALIRFLYKEHVEDSSGIDVRGTLRKIADIEEDLDEALKFSGADEQWKLLAA